MKAVNHSAVEVDSDDNFFARLKSASRFVIPEEITSFSSVDAEVLTQIVTKSLEIITGTKSEVSFDCGILMHQRCSATE